MKRLLLIGLLIVGCNNSTEPVEDCAGVLDGTAVEDCAGVCNGDAIDYGTCPNDCGGGCSAEGGEVCGEIDECGVCKGEDVNDDGYCQGDLDFLQDFVDANASIQGMPPLYVGNQTWEDGRLVKFYMSSGTTITTWPASIGNLTALYHLSGLGLPGSWYNGENEFSDLPEEMWNLTNLSYLNLSYESLKGAMPESICNLTKLHTLSFHHNAITSIPECISNLQNLQEFKAGNNQLACLPLSICELDNDVEAGSCQGLINTTTFAYNCIVPSCRYNCICMTVLQSGNGMLDCP